MIRFLQSSDASRTCCRTRTKSGLNDRTTLVPFLITWMSTIVPWSVYAAKLISWNSTCSTRRSQSPKIFFPRKYFDQSVCGSSMTSKVLHLSLLTVAFGPDNKPLAIPAAVVFDGELGALGDGPFLIGRMGTWPCSWASRNSPWRSPELKRLFRKPTPVEKLSRKLENEILAVWKDKSKKNYVYIYNPVEVAVVVAVEGQALVVLVYLQAALLLVFCL